MVITQQATQSLAALNIPVAAGVRAPREQQDIALPLVIPFGMKMFDIFAQRSARRAASLGHVLGNGRLRDRKAEPEQFALNPRRAPKHILNAHLPDQCPQTRVDWWPASQASRFPAPIAAKARAMPSHQRLGSAGRHHLHDRWKPSLQLEDEQALAARAL